MFVATLFGIFAEGASQPVETGASHEANLDRIRAVARNIALTASQQLQAIGAKKLQLAVFPKESAWTLEGSLRDALQSEGWSFSEGVDTTMAAEFGIADARVEYDNIRRDGFLGPKLVDRNVRLTLSTKVFDSATRRVLLQADFQDSLKDIIELSEIQNMENPALAFTKGTLPHEGFFSNIAEPLILVGAIAVAVLLLFNVRS